MSSAERFSDNQDDYIEVQRRGDRVFVDAFEKVSHSFTNASLSYTSEQAEALADALLDAARMARTV